MPAAFTIGRALVVEPGADGCLLSTGNMLSEAVEARRRLHERGLSAEVVILHTIESPDTGYLQCAFGRFKLVGTIEENFLIGGFGAAVAEWAVDTGSSPFSETPSYRET